ncbi:hypothetical protein FRB95_002441 [Tulasnella sp. JGI-2019a]|nr:hypothetical protein FRB95_002441 [Tulasnella sp. JGI-2019a]
MEDDAYANPDVMETGLKAHPGHLMINKYPNDSSNSNSDGEYIALGNHSDDDDDDSDSDSNDTNKKPIKMVLAQSPPATHHISASPHVACCASKPASHRHYSPEKHLGQQHKGGTTIKKAKTMPSKGSAACHKSCQAVIMDPVEELDDAKDDIESDETIINKSWCAAAELGGEDTDDMPLKNEYISLITGVWTQLRGHLKSEVKPLVELTYGFIQEKEDPDIILQNTAIYEALTSNDLAYTCEDYKNVKFRWYNQIMMIIICRICFAMSCSDGYQYEDYFHPIPLQLITLVYAAIKCVLDEWSDGEWRPLQFEEGAYQDVYLMLLANLRNLVQWSKVFERKFREDIWKQVM